MFQEIQGWLKNLTDFGVAVILAAVIIDIVVPNATGITANIGMMVQQFSEAGLAGFIALLLFTTFWQRRSEPTAPPSSGGF
jgi:TRAP-type uncharacterized transport system fused permease subunit